MLYYCLRCKPAAAQGWLESVTLHIRKSSTREASFEGAHGLMG